MHPVLVEMWQHALRERQESWDFLKRKREAQKVRENWGLPPPKCGRPCPALTWCLCGRRPPDGPLTHCVIRRPLEPGKEVDTNCPNNKQHSSHECRLSTYCVLVGGSTGEAAGTMR